MAVLPTLQKQRHPLASGEAQRRRLAGIALPRSFEEALDTAGLYPLRATGIEVLQVNLGKKCNQTCHHCHVDAGPDRTETMSAEILDACLRVLAASDIPTLDVTGGAPELHPEFRRIIEEGSRARPPRDGPMQSHGHPACPTTATSPPFWRSTASRSSPRCRTSRPGRPTRSGATGCSRTRSPPCASSTRWATDEPGSGLVLNLVTNPVGAFLPPAQAAAERDWRRELERRHGIVFNRLYTITNMPISRFLEHLDQKGQTDAYVSPPRPGIQSRRGAPA